MPKTISSKILQTYGAAKGMLHCPWVGTGCCNGQLSTRWTARGHGPETGASRCNATKNQVSSGGWHGHARGGTHRTHGGGAPGNVRVAGHGHTLVHGTRSTGTGKPGSLLPRHHCAHGKRQRVSSRDARHWSSYGSDGHHQIFPIRSYWCCSVGARLSLRQLAARLGRGSRRLAWTLMTPCHPSGGPGGPKTVRGCIKVRVRNLPFLFTISPSFHGKLHKEQVRAA